MYVFTVCKKYNNFTCGYRLKYTVKCVHTPCVVFPKTNNI